MLDKSKHTVGLVGRNALASAVARQARAAGIEVVDGATARVGLLLVADPAALEGAGTDLPTGATVVDLTPGDPALAQALAKSLAERGISFVDAPLHCEHLGRFPAEAAFLCGGASQDLEAVTPLLEKMGAKVVVCGGVGAGKVARAIVGAVAVCNRLITLEGAGMGFRNGLTVSDMGSVLERCSGSNSGTARVLPAIAESRRTSDMPLADAAAELALCVQLARRVGAPVLLATQAYTQVLGASRTAGPDATLDELRCLVEGGSGFSFTA
jgi:3-hydroxyisobutyrate dehydrogenase